MNESNRRIASLNRIDELNQRIAFQNDPLIASWAAKTVPKEPKILSRRAKSPPRPSKRAQEPPRAAQDPSQDDPRPPQERSWNGLGAVLGPLNNKIEIQTAQGQSPQTFWADFGPQNGAQNDPKSTSKRIKNQDEKCITFLSLLDSS